MTTLGEIVRQYGAAYRAQYGEQLLPSQRAALQAIEHVVPRPWAVTSTPARPKTRKAQSAAEWPA